MEWCFKKIDELDPSEIVGMYNLQKERKKRERSPISSIAFEIYTDSAASSHWKSSAIAASTEEKNPRSSGSLVGIHLADYESLQ